MDVPVYIDRVVTVPIELTKIEIQTIERERIKEVPVDVVRVVKEIQIVEIEKPVYHIERHP